MTTCVIYDVIVISVYYANTQRDAKEISPWRGLIIKKPSTASPTPG